jgi:opacity protein-like surface antigen
MKRLLLVLGSIVLLLIPASSYADVIFTPFGGVTFAGNTSSSGANAPPSKPAFGASVTFMGAAAGLEVEFGYAPDFFGEQHGTVLVADSNVTTFMGNVIFGVGRGPVRPYVAGGVGLIRPRINTSGLFSSVSANDFGLDAGGGIMVFVTHNVGVRGDLRYFRRLTDPSADNDLDLTLSDFHFWRMAGALSFKF